MVKDKLITEKCLDWSGNEVDITAVELSTEKGETLDDICLKHKKDLEPLRNDQKRTLHIKRDNKIYCYDPVELQQKSVKYTNLKGEWFNYLDWRSDYAKRQNAKRFILLEDYK